MMQQAPEDRIVDVPIADPRILQIPIEESNEELVDLQQWSNPRIIHISELEPSATVVHDQWSKVRKGLSERIVEMLDLFEPDLGIAVMEALRPRAVQKIYFQLKLKEVRKTIKDDAMAKEEASKYISPPDIDAPVHCTGAAIDMTLFRINSNGNTLLDLGKIGALENDQARTLCETLTEEQARNRKLLLSTASQAGLVNYGFEWWHYSYGDRMWAFANGKPAAVYGAVSEPGGSGCGQCSIT